MPAIDGVLQAFHDHPLVAIGDNHQMAQQGAFYVVLVSDPRFAATVQDVVFEFGAGVHQATMDRYLNGEAVPYEELRLTWTDTVGFRRWNSRKLGSGTMVRQVGAGQPA